MKKVALLIILIFNMNLYSTPVFAKSMNTEPVIDAKAAYAIDADTGKILFDQNGEQPLPIASITKILSLYLVFEAVQAGDISWSDPIEISDYLHNISLSPELSNVPLYQDTTYTVRDAFEAAAISSANAATIALAKTVAGSEPEFVDLMMAKLKSWGISDAYLVTSTGLDNDSMEGRIYPGSSINDVNRMSAKSIAIVARHLIQDFPEYLEISQVSEKVFGEQSAHPFPMTNSNHMLYDYSVYREGVDGLKTGTTDKAGACFVGTIQSENYRLITVVLNAHQHEVNNNARFIETNKLIDFVEHNWSLETVLKKHDPATPASSAVENGKETSVQLILENDVSIWVPNNADVHTSLELTEEKLSAPLAKETVVGTQKAYVPSDELGYIDGTKENNQTNVLTETAVDKANIFVLFWRALTNLF